MDVTVLTDSPASAAGDKVIRVPNLTDIESALTAVHRAGRPTFDIVHTDFEAAIVMTAVLARVLGCAVAVDHQLAVLGRDKYLQKRQLAAAGVPVTEIEMIPDLPGLRARYRPEFGYPVIIKPALGSGATNVRRADNDQELDGALASLSGAGPYVCERFVAGAELHVDGIVHDGTLHFLSVGRYVYNPIEVDGAKSAGSLILPHTGHESLYEACETLVVQVIAAFGHHQGALHMEVFASSDGLVFSECGLRHGGAKIPEAIMLASGADLRELSFLAGIGRLPQVPVSRPVRPAGCILFAAGPGQLQSLPADDDLLSIHGVDQVSFDRDRLGQVLRRPTTLESVGYCTFTGDSVDAARKTFDRLYETAARYIRCAAA